MQRFVFLLPYARQGRPKASVFFTGMGTAFDMVEHLAERRLGWYDHTCYFITSSSHDAQILTGWPSFDIVVVGTSQYR